MIRETGEADIVAEVVVLYRPDNNIINHLNALASSVDLLIVVVNDMEPSLADDLHRVKATLIVNRDNKGLAAALNQGIARAFSNPAIGFVLLLDQDSRPVPDMPTLLRAAYRDATHAGLKPACVGPMLADIKARRRASYGGADRAPNTGRTAAVPTSGSLISREAFETVGSMREDLFIDCIDYEWCFRARALGYDILRCSDTTMSHDMGEMGISVLGRYRPLYRSAIRHYYIIRNTVLLTRLNHVPIGWKIVSIFKTLYRIPVYLFVSEDRRTSLHRMVAGIIEGLGMPTGTKSRAGS